MKLIFAIMKDDDVENVVPALTAVNFRVTRVASTGGLFRKGSTTLLIGVDDDQVEPAIQVLRDKTTLDANEQKRATVFVVPVNRFEQL
ncbi:MAG TPA: cyclic-di-AMP receptor [Anaerolineales bacterium]|jgi:uncharacterized protein YaaQ